jgi:hypothetical protein
MSYYRWTSQKDYLDGMAREFRCSRLQHELKTNTNRVPGSLHPANLRQGRNGTRKIPQPHSALDQVWRVRDFASEDSNPALANVAQPPAERLRSLRIAVKDETCNIAGEGMPGVATAFTTLSHWRNMIVMRTANFHSPNGVVVEGMKRVRQVLRNSEFRAR